MNELKVCTESGGVTLISWMGSVPAHWRRRRLKSVVAQVLELSGSTERGGPYIALEHVEGWTGKAKPQTGSGLFSGQVKQFRAGDILFGKLRPYLAKVTRPGVDGVCAGEFFVLRVQDPVVDARYLEYVLRSRPCIDFVTASTFGARMPRADWQFCGSLPVPVPTHGEQAAIVRFLDHVGGRIERAIRAKRKVIALLQEQKQAIIQQAVTRGFTAGVSLTPSGVPWLGSFPAHWEMRRLSSMATFISGKAHEHFVDPAGEHICVTARFVSTAGASGRRCTKNFSPARRGDVLMVMSDLPNGRALARAFMVEDHASYAVNQRVCILRPHAMDPQFLAYAANRNRGLLRHDDGSNQTHLSNGDFKTLPIQCPPRAEQEAIVASVRPALAAIEKRLALVAREIDLLQEYRTRLTADVVTGKLDVREAASKLPAEPLDTDLTTTTDPTDEPIDEEAVVE